MLTVYRRHLKTCAHKSEGRAYRRCRCPLWVDGTLGGRDTRRSLGHRDWERGQDQVREWESRGSFDPEPEPITVEQAIAQFLRDAEARGLRQSTLRKYLVLFSQMKAFAGKEGYTLLKQWDVGVVRAFRQTWSDAGVSSMKKLERLRAFLNFARDSGWITHNPAAKLKDPIVRQPPTLPFTEAEMGAILAACERYTDTYGRTGQPNSKRLRALVLLLRYSGLRVGDAVTCAMDRLKGDRLFLYTAKTGTPVYVKLPQFVVDALHSFPPMSPQFFFWTGDGAVETVTGNYRRSLRALFKLAGLKGAHAHRFRDTFAVELLMAGVPLERVSVLLGHSSVRVTEQHYSPWVEGRQQQLEADLERAWARDPIVLAQTKGTPEVREERATTQTLHPLLFSLVSRAGLAPVTPVVGT